jgi:hypothetical protein
MTSIALVAFVVLAVFTFMPVGANAEVEKDNDFGTVIGIDLGTTYSCVAYVSLLKRMILISLLATLLLTSARYRFYAPLPPLLSPRLPHRPARQRSTWR